jgi:arsenate reductase
MKKVYHLGTCSTCQAIIKKLQLAQKGFILQDIKIEKISQSQVDEMKKFAGNYEKLFSRRAIKYKEWGLKDKVLTENDYRQYILDEYTFLKRPVVIINDEIFIGSEKKNVEEMKRRLDGGC